MALYPMAIRSDDDKWRTCPYLQASQISISNCILEILLIPTNSRFLLLIDNFGLPPDDRYHLEILGWRIKMHRYIMDKGTNKRSQEIRG
jgi:hypothetical protein